MVECIGQQLGNYRLTRLLGQGGSAEVYLGEHVYLKTPGAIKLLHTKGANQKELEGFLREAQAIAQLVHPHIVRVLEFGVHQEEMPYLVMDYAANGTLRQRYPGKTPLSLTTILPFVKQVAAALQHAHDARIIHRDIKPENMLLGRDGQVLLSDFGIALRAHSSIYLRTQEVAGTAAYMAPEQFRGKPCLASDQYALSVVVYEWLTGERPFHGSVIELATQHIFAPPPPLHEKVPTISPVVEYVVLRALAKTPQERYASVEEFARELERVAASYVAVDPPQASTRPQTYQKAPPRLPRRTTLEQATVPPRPPAVGEALSQIPTQPQTHQKELPHFSQQMPFTPDISIPSSKLRKRLRSPFVIALSILLALLLPFVGIFGVYNFIPGRSLPDKILTLVSFGKTVSAPVQTWHTLGSGTSQRLSGVAWSGSQFVAVGVKGTILTSPNGHAWTPQDAPSQSDLFDVAWSGSLIVAVGAGGTILTSSNGHTWTLENILTPNDLEGVVWSGTQFVAVGEGGTILTSPDGRTWTSQNASSESDLSGVAWSGTFFVTVGVGGVIRASPNGSTWTAYNFGTSQDLHKVAWSGSLFVAVGDTGTILTSSNGSHWDLHQMNTNQDLEGVAWSGAQIAAVGTSGALFTSPDGSNWALENTSSESNLFDVAWSGTQFVAVGEGGTILIRS